MYKAKYTVERDTKGNKMAGLSVVFDFSKEIPPKAREEVKERTCCDEDGQLRRYLAKKERLTYSSSESHNIKMPSWGITPGFWYSFEDRKKVREVKINHKEDGLKIVIWASIRRYIPLEQILNLDALNKFILTGRSD